MKVFSILASAAVLIVMTALVDAQRLLRSEASTATATVGTADFSTLSSGSGFTPGNVEAQSNFGALDKEGSTGGNRPSGSMQGGAGRGVGGSGHNGMQNVGSGEGLAHGSGSFGGHGGFGRHGGHGRGEGSFSGSDFAGSFGGHDFGGSGFGGNFGGSGNGEMPSIGSGEVPTRGSGEAPAAATTTSTTSSVAASSSA